MTPLPGVKVGPLDPDATADFGQVSQRNSARTLIRLHAQMHPPQLMRVLGRKLDPARTKGLVRSEVADYVGGLSHPNGDPFIPKDGEFLAAAVRGEPDGEQMLTIVYRNASGRTAKWFAPYNEDVLPDSYAAGTELSHVAEMRDRGVVAFDNEGHATEVLQREAADLRRQVRALRSQIESADASGKPLAGSPQGDARRTEVIVDEAETLRRANQELMERVASLEQLVGQGQGPEPAAAEAETTSDTLSAPVPMDGYESLNAVAVVKILKDPETTDEQRVAILEYERTHANRASVVSAGEGSLGTGG